MQAWLQELSRAAAGHWSRLPMDTAPSGPATWSATWPTGTGRAPVTIALHGRTLWWREADGTLWSAELPAGVALPPPPPAEEDAAASAAR
jgi:hypothetical protein